MADNLPIIDTLDAIFGSHDVVLCDVWGVIHNGLRAFPEACAALARARQAGKIVIMITNAPRPHGDVAAQMAALGVPDGTYDGIVTSGDVTRKLITEGPRHILHIGPDRDLSLYDGLDVELCEEREAAAVVCTGLYDDETEAPGDYADMLARLRGCNLPFICANPDIVVERGEALIWCAGALARDYSQLGGRTLIAGKPHAPIYEAALDMAADLAGRPMDRRQVLAIGDGIMTDAKGATDNGVSLLYISAGIHAGEYGPADRPDHKALAAFLAKHGQKPAAIMPRLR